MKVGLPTRVHMSNNSHEGHTTNIYKSVSELDSSSADSAFELPPHLHLPFRLFSFFAEITLGFA